MPFRFTLKRCVVAILGSIVTVVAIEALMWLRPPPKLVVGRDTTFLTSPLDANGNVDYDAAWREEHLPGVTAENNAAPLIYAVMGFDLSTFTAEERLVAPKVERPFQQFYEWAQSHGDQLARPADPKGDAEKEVRTSLDAGDLHGPQERAIAAWFESIAPSLAIVESATKRERFFASDGAPRTEMSKRYWNVLEVGRALAWRAHRRARSGDLDAACSDLCTLLRLARLIRSMDGFLHFTIATGCESCFREVAGAIAADHVPLSAASLRLLSAAREMRPLASMNSAWLASVRISGLHAFEYFHQLKGPGPFQFFSRLDPNRLNRAITAWADRIDAAWKDPRGWPERVEAADAVRREAIRVQRAKSHDLTIWVLLCGPDQATEWFAEGFSAMELDQTGYLEEFICDLAQEDRLLAEQAASAFAKQAGHDPVSSEELTPTVFPTPFRDRLFDSSLIFTRNEKHELVASGPLADLLARLDALSKSRR